MAFVGDPPLELWRPHADEVHVSVAFTWDTEEGERLRKAWGQYYSRVIIGGPAFQMTATDDFEPGVYVKHGVTFTSRGCDNKCPWCMVPDREGKLIEYKYFSPGYIIADNNLLQASQQHQAQVFAMLRTQRAAVFSGGLQASLLTDWFCDQLRTIKINQLFLAADTMGALRPLEKAVDKLSFLPRGKKRVYTMIGTETIEAATERLEAVWKLGGMPFAQLYRAPIGWKEYSREWCALVRTWSRPAAMMALHASQEEAK
jgi:hypothetical protein